MPETKTYYAISIFSSRTFWWNAANGLIALLSLAEVTTMIPPRFLSVQLAVVAAVNMWLRSITVRPAVLASPGTVTPVQVPTLAPPEPPVVSD